MIIHVKCRLNNVDVYENAMMHLFFFFLICGKKEIRDIVDSKPIIVKLLLKTTGNFF